MIKDLQQQSVNIAGAECQLLHKLNTPKSADVPRLVIVSKLPDKRTIPLLRMSIEAIRKFTSSPYELWIVDNNSPMEHLEWLYDYPELQLVFNRTQAAEPGSYENGIALDIASKLVLPQTRYFMTMHQDTLACKGGWLDYLLSKFSEEIRAVGVREDFGRVPEGVLHVLGYVVDFQLVKKLNLSFMPELPAYDVGDKVIVGLKHAGYKTFAAKNSLWDHEVVDNLPANSVFKNFNVDRSVDDSGDVFFLHLGRGLLKSTGQSNDLTKTSVDIWQTFIENNLLN